MNRLNLPYFDVLICNLYPFLDNQIIENIDIGGVSLLRAGSKNFKNIAVLSNPNQYHTFINQFSNDQNLGFKLNERKNLAFKAFRHISKYDEAISNYLNPSNIILKYGMNPHQNDTSILFGENKPFTLINGTMGMINVIDVIHGWLTVKEIDTILDISTAISMKHTSLAGLAVGNDISEYTLNYFGLKPTDEITEIGRSLEI